MWHIITTLLCIACVHGYQRSVNNPYPSYVVNERQKPAPTYPNYPQSLALYNAPKQFPDYSQVNPPAGYNYYSHRNPSPYMQSQYSDDIFIKPSGQYYLRTNNLRQPQSGSKSSFYQPQDPYPFDLDYGNAGSDMSFGDDIVEPRGNLEIQSYFEDLELVENFGNYLKRRTQIDGSSTAMNDAAHQYNALMSVLIALARVVRNSCSDFEQVYDQLYLPTVETYYKYGLANAEKVSGMIDDYVRKGNSHIPKLRKLKQDLCEKELFCSVSVDNRIKSSPLLYVKELETLEAIAHLARSYYPYIEEFNQASQTGTVLQYLQKGKERIKEYVMHIVNSVEHLTDKQVRCP